MLRLVSGYEISNLANGDIEIFSLRQNKTILFQNETKRELCSALSTAIKTAFLMRTSVNAVVLPILDKYFR